MSVFEEGYEKFIKSIGAEGVFESKAYIRNVEKEIETLKNNMNQFKGFKTDTSQLKGDIAEFWHSGTHNIDAAVKGLESKTQVIRSHGFASADIDSNFGSRYGLKYYSTASDSAKQQAKSYFEIYKQQGKSGKTFIEFLSERGISEEEVLMHDPVYNGQIRIIPKEQLEDAIEFLKRKIQEESLKRPELVNKYEETLNKLSDRIRSNKGSESIPLSEVEAKEIANMAKEGGFEPEKFGITTEELIKFKHIMQQSLKAGLTAGTISLVLRVAPEIFKAIEQLLSENKISKEQFKKMGFAAFQGGTEGFVRGTISAAITTACLSGSLGTTLKTVDPSLIGAITVVTMNTIQNAIKLSLNTMSKSEFVNCCMRDLFITTCSVFAGGLTQGIIEIPVFGYMLGSFVGSIVGSFCYDKGYSIFISFCADSGFNFFGLVEQNYDIPSEILESIGIRVFEYEKLDFERLNLEKLDLERFAQETFDYETLEITFIRRGVIGVNKIGYIC